MAKKTRAQITTDISTLLADNTSQDITPQDVRDVSEDLNESQVNWEDDIDTDGTLAADSDNYIPTQKAVKTYVDGLTYLKTLTVRVTPTDALTLNSVPVTAITGTANIFRLIIGGTAFVYTGSTPYNEISPLIIRQGAGEAVTSNDVTASGENSSICAAIITDGSNNFGSSGISSANNINIAANNDLTGGDLGWDVTLFYVEIPVS